MNAGVGLVLSLIEESAIFPWHWERQRSYKGKRAATLSGSPTVTLNFFLSSIIMRFLPCSLIASMALAFLAAPIFAVEAEVPREVVTYEAFGAVGDGLTDDLPAICAAHAHANAHRLPVRSNPEATYHLGRRGLTAVIETDTDWSTSRFIIDDSQGVEDHRRSLFEVRSRFEPESLRIERLARGQERIDVRPTRDLLVLVENNQRNIFIRRGLNRNKGTPQKEVFILRQDGTIEGGVDWDYETVTRIEAYPIDQEPLVLRGGIFINLANRMKQERGYNYWSRNILITRSNTEVDGLVHQVVGETDFGHPYSGFLSVRMCANITLRNCSIDGRKVYRTIGSAGEPVSMGTYGYGASYVVNFRMIGCRSENIHDRTRWGVIGTNFMKNILLEDCTLSRMDVHMGVSGSYIIRRSTLGYMGLNAIGRGLLLVEDSTLHGNTLISFRSDYGSTWDGDVIVRNTRWIPPAGRGGLALLSMSNDGQHDFGYSCSMPRTVQIEGLTVDDSTRPDDAPGLAIFNASLGAPGAERPFPYRLTERLDVAGLKTARGLPPRVSDNPELVSAVTAVINP